MSTPLQSPARRSKKTRREHRVIVACMPKSGSTFLTELLAQIRGMRHAYLVPGYHRREQEICLEHLKKEIYKTELLRQMQHQGTVRHIPKPRGFVAQMHLRYTKPTATILREHGIVPIVLVRNLFDVVVSMKDHLCNRPVAIPMAYFSTEMRGWPTDRIYAFIADMIIPWYLNFYISWSNAEHVKRVTYEELVQDPKATLGDIADHVGLPHDSESLDIAVSEAQTRTPRNVGIVGRGEQLPMAVKERIRQLAAYYDDHDFSPLGL